MKKSALRLLFELLFPIVFLFLTPAVYFTVRDAIWKMLGKHFSKRK